MPPGPARCARARCASLHRMASRSKVHPSHKTLYGVTNWAEYDKGLVGRGSLSIWLAPDALKAWRPRKTGRRGGQRRDSDRAIGLALQLRLVFRLPWRQTEGFLRSLFGLLKCELEVPDHTTLSRRCRRLRVKLEAPCSSRSIHLVIDDTRLKVFGASMVPGAPTPDGANSTSASILAESSSRQT